MEMLKSPSADQTKLNCRVLVNENEFLLWNYAVDISNVFLDPLDRLAEKNYLKQFNWLSFIERTILSASRNFQLNFVGTVNFPGI